MDADGLDQLRRFYHADRRALYIYARSITGSREAAEDVLHDVFCRLIERGRLPTELRPFVFRAIRNQAIDCVRRRRPESIAFDRAIGGEDVLVTERLVHDALSALGTDEREAVVLKAFGGFTLREIGGLLGANENTVSSWYRRGLDRMRRRIEEDER